MKMPKAAQYPGYPNHRIRPDTALSGGCCDPNGSNYKGNLQLPIGPSGCPLRFA